MDSLNGTVTVDGLEGFIEVGHYGDGLVQAGNLFGEFPGSVYVLGGGDDYIHGRETEGVDYRLGLVKGELSRYQVH
jgi:hypothetical protein